MNPRSKGIAARTLARSTLKESVSDYLRELIFSGQLRPNERIDQDQIAASLGVSKLPVREALINLENEALVRVVPRRGTFVAPLTPDDVRDHYRIYGLVLGVAAERATYTMTEDGITKLEELIHGMESGTSADEQDDLNFEFHRRINVAGGSHRLLSVVRLLANTMPTRFFEFTTGWARQAAIEHRRIMEAIRAGEAEEASKAMVAHMRSGGEHAVLLLESSGFWAERDSGDQADSTHE